MRDDFPGRSPRADGEFGDLDLAVGVDIDPEDAELRRLAGEGGKALERRFFGDGLVKECWPIRR